jgi:pyruvate,orthophosphate dikinase
MPGMMETVLNVGLNDETVLGLAEVSGDARFAWDSYRRLIEMFGARFSASTPSASTARSTRRRCTSSTRTASRELVGTLKAEVRDATGEDFPSDPRTQLALAIRAVFRSWNTARAVRYRREKRIDDSVGTAVNVVAMVFGNRGDDSGTGVAFTRDPSSGRQGVYGDYLADAQGEDVVGRCAEHAGPAGARRDRPDVYAELLQVMERLERHYRDVCDIEFTVENGKLWLLQTRVAQPTAEAVFRIAAQLADEGLIDEDEALLRVTGAHLSKLLFPRFADSTPSRSGSVWGPRRAPRWVMPSSTRRRRSPGRPRASRSSSCGARPIPTTSTA